MSYAHKTDTAQSQQITTLAKLPRYSEPQNLNATMSTMLVTHEAGQFGGKINKNDLPSLALKRQQKSFVMSQRQSKRQL